MLDQSGGKGHQHEIPSCKNEGAKAVLGTNATMGQSSRGGVRLKLHILYFYILTCNLHWSAFEH